MSGRADLAAAFADIRAWLFDRALPLWSTRGTDFEHGGFIEKLAPDGAILAEPRRARVTGRQIYAFATAEKLGWPGPARAILRHGIKGLDRFVSPAGLVIRTTDETGTVLDDGFDLYDHAFVLFGLAAAASVGEKAADLEALAEGIRGRMQAGFAHPRAGFEESRPRSLPLKANPHMHMLEASLAWAAISDDPAWMALADEIAELCLATFLDPGTGALREYFDGDWIRIDTPPDDVVEPGHQFEWAWLLLRWGRLRRRDDALSAARRLIAVGEGPGVDAVGGLAINELNRDLSIRDDRCRLWPQTERTKAHCLAMALADDDAERDAAAGRAAAALRGLMRFFEHPVAGAWYEHIGADGKPMIEPTRASSLYHITCAVAEVADRLG
ncbi:AGE family epimerase/isomerase [Zavarzinia compransoris]|uniref:AGE family epimerase/isomerase n=1 Tax=Zavarzinia marina TaxID=2911065 RepID=UPI001F33D8BF|nr:AGE family epimerase/isomerase [Zavarzinia marina]MCF4167257.1 AGE family epimerase/isomerase [Zavarzinia marina]